MAVADMSPNDEEFPCETCLSPFRKWDLWNSTLDSQVRYLSVSDEESEREHVIQKWLIGPRIPLALEEAFFPTSSCFQVACAWTLVPSLFSCPLSGVEYRGFTFYLALGENDVPNIN